MAKKMVMWSFVPRRCVFCHSAGTVVVAWGIWRGDVAAAGIVGRASATGL